MARLIYLAVLYFAYNFGNCAAQGNIAESSEANIDVKLVPNPSVKYPVEIPRVIILTLNTTKENTNTTNVKLEATPTQTLNAQLEAKNVTQTINSKVDAKNTGPVEIPKFITLQGRAGVAAPNAPSLTKTIKYKLGSRVPGQSIELNIFFLYNSIKLDCLSGDKLIASNSISQQWTAAQNVTQNLTYPRAGAGAVITYVEVVVDQVSFNQGDFCTYSI